MFRYTSDIPSMLLATRVRTAFVLAMIWCCASWGLPGPMLTFSGISVGVLVASVGFPNSLALSAAILFVLIASLFFAGSLRQAQ